MRSFLTTLVQGERFARSLDEEVRFHLHAQTGDLIRMGVSPAEAARRAREQFGNVEAMKKACRRERGLWLIDELGSGAHLRQMLRSLFEASVIRSGPRRGWPSRVPPTASVAREGN